MVSLYGLSHFVDLTLISLLKLMFMRPDIMVSTDNGYEYANIWKILIKLLEQI